MKHFFAHLYEWFGLAPLYSKDMSAFLKGLDVSCTGYFALPWYFYVGVLSFVFTAVIFGLQYDLISSERFKKRAHWGLSALMVAAACFFTAFTVPFVAVETGSYCPSLNLSVSDCIGFGISNAVWGIIFFSVFSLIQMRLNSMNKKSA